MTIHVFRRNCFKGVVFEADEGKILKITYTNGTTDYRSVYSSTKGIDANTWTEAKEKSLKLGYVWEKDRVHRADVDWRNHGDCRIEEHTMK